MSRVSWAVRRCFHSGITATVRMLWSRSASLMTSTRQSVRHGHEHLAHRGGLLGLLGVELQPVELGHPVDDGAHLGAELLGDVLEGEPGVLHGVVQQGRGHRPGVEAQLGHDGGDGHGVGDVGLPGLAELALVRLLGDLAGPDDQLAIGGAGPGPAGVVGRQHAPHQVVEHRRPAERSSQTLDGDHLLTVPGRPAHRAPRRCGR